MIIAFAGGRELARLDGVTASWAIKEFVENLRAAQ
jgi:hypothetical protein